MKMKKVILRNFCAMLFAHLFFLQVAFAGNPVDCLKKQDPINCLASEAQSRLDQSKDGTLRSEKYGSLLVTLATAGHRQDSIYFASEKATLEAGSLLSQWQLMIGRYTYALRFLPSPLLVEYKKNIFSLAGLLDKRLDPTDTLYMTISACEAREAIASKVRDDWRFFLDDQCRSDLYDLEKLNDEDRLLWVIMAPFIDSSNRDRSSLDESIEKSSALAKAFEEDILSLKDRERKNALLGLSLLSRAIQVIAYANMGSSQKSKDAILELKNKLKDKVIHENKSVYIKDMTRTVKSMMPTMLAMVGLFAEAKVELKTVLGDMGRAKKLSIDDAVDILDSAIEAQSLIQTGLPH